MRFIELANSYEMIEATSSRISMTYYCVLKTREGFKKYDNRTNR